MTVNLLIERFEMSVYYYYYYYYDAGSHTHIGLHTTNRQTAPAAAIHLVCGGKLHGTEIRPHPHRSPQKIIHITAATDVNPHLMDAY